MNMDIKFDYDEDVEVLEETDTEEDLSDGKKLIVHNDDHNTFDYVIECLMKVCKLETEEAIQCTYIVHHRGKCVVKEGDDDILKPMKEALRTRGLSVTIED